MLLNITEINRDEKQVNYTLHRDELYNYSRFDGVERNQFTSRKLPSLREKNIIYRT